MNVAGISRNSACMSYVYGAVGVTSDWAVREDKAFYVPELLTDPEYEVGPEVYAAGEEQVRHLREAEGLVCEARDLVGLMLAALEYETDGRAMQMDAALRVIEGKLKGAFEGIDRGRKRYLNLFLVCFGHQSEHGS